MPWAKDKKLPWTTDDKTHAKFVAKLRRRGVPYTNCNSGFCDHKRYYCFMIEVDGFSHPFKSERLHPPGAIPSDAVINEAVSVLTDAVIVARATKHSRVKGVLYR